ncbi:MULTISPECIES: hypothetical protein [Brevibacillus]|uniref:hypothetical protein n=1 Tax=Brevibacillus TaxID=55080 RepID=UPI00057BD223|nr:hypothetical protein [Brevibacillus borstelensis]MCM3590434.1 hypothetical protein [Brevibacillus borstelensis]MED1742848.1 hypothetical protein [Brevibacillus borstelensis]NOU57819.1 hypothetical protein [Brevibacillus borstelensis]
MNTLRSCASFCDSLGSIAERTVPASLRDEDRSGEWKQASLHRSRFLKVEKSFSPQPERFTV